MSLKNYGRAPSSEQINLVEWKAQSLPLKCGQVETLSSKKCSTWADVHRYFQPILSLFVAWYQCWGLGGSRNGPLSSPVYGWWHFYHSVLSGMTSNVYAAKWDRVLKFSSFEAVVQFSPGGKKVSHPIRMRGGQQEEWEFRYPKE